MLAAAEARVERLRGELATAIKEAALFREILALQDEGNRSNISGNMQAITTGKSRATKISAAKGADTKSRRAAIAADLTDGEIAVITGASRQAVQKWHAGLLAIPRRHADRLAARHGISVDSWSRLAD